MIPAKWHKYGDFDIDGGTIAYGSTHQDNLFIDMEMDNGDCETVIFPKKRDTIEMLEDLLERLK